MRCIWYLYANKVVHYSRFVSTVCFRARNAVAADAIIIYFHINHILMIKVGTRTNRRGQPEKYWLWQRVEKKNLNCAGRTSKNTRTRIHTHIHTVTKLTYLGASFIKANLPKSSPSFNVATVPLPWITTSTDPFSNIYQERPSSPWLNTVVIFAAVANRKKHSARIKPTQKSPERCTVFDVDVESRRKKQQIQRDIDGIWN